VDAYVGLGSNVGDRWSHLRAGVAGLTVEGLAPLVLSSVWESEPVDCTDPALFLNMVVRVDADRDGPALIEALLSIERDAGRVRGRRNAPRTLDLDLLLLGRQRVRRPGLCLPHPRMWRRRFVLEPLAEIAPDFRDPASGRSVAEQLERLSGGPAVARVGRLGLPA
jgi:2-amino-4-hydroxy-6-hydroxymethyldihydropteridine diphosphokinase